MLHSVDPLPCAAVLAARWPRAGDAAAGRNLIERFRAAAPQAAYVPDALLAALGGGSPFLADLAVREAATLAELAIKGPDVVVADVLNSLSATPLTVPREAMAAALRGAKRKVGLAVAVADVGEVWRLERITAVLSDLAEAVLHRAVAHLLAQAAGAGRIALPHPHDPERGSGLIVLGMGKLGGHELNYSSDIDLILLHDPAAGLLPADNAGPFFTRVARDLVALLETRTADGYVFRTDLRLRPDPTATPPCMSLAPAIAYYESMGQNWERAAMLKARPVAGDIPAGLAFLEAIRPFVWRRGLDFAAIADIHAMKRRIDAHKATAMAACADPVERVLGYDVKLGQGGIREIEFLAQTLQLVWGGRDPGLRARSTRAALIALARGKHLPWRAAGELAAAYRFLRRVEHRTQMVADRQTHALPDRREALEPFARFLGLRDAAELADRLLRHLDRVRARYADLFDAPLRGAREPGSLPLPTGPANPAPEMEAALAELGFADPEGWVERLRGWQAGRPRALRSDRARELLAEILPRLLQALAGQREPDAALGRFDTILNRIPAGVPLLSLFQRNPVLLERVASVLGAAPSLADHLARTPGALEGLLTPEAARCPAALMNTRLTDARTLEDAIAIIRRTVREEEFAISVSTLEARMDADGAGTARAGLADAALCSLFPRVLADFSQRFGSVPGGAIAVVLLGKAGGREMMAGSDLDLMFIYDHPPEATESIGGRPLPASTWFIRAVHAFVAALTAPDASGPMYAVDMRLRPSGNKGPVAVALDSFERYHALGAGGAWTWERMALTRARVVAGPEAHAGRVTAAIGAALAHAGPPDRVLADAAAMRARLLRDLPPHGPWDAKLRMGGAIEVEFVAQALQLVHAPEHPCVCAPSTREALSRLAVAAVLDGSDAARLIQADRIWRTVQGQLRLTEGRGARAELSPSAAAPLLRALASDLHAVDAASLRATLDALAHQVTAVFVRLVGEFRS